MGTGHDFLVWLSVNDIKARSSRSFGSIVYYVTGCLWLFRYPENVESAQYYGLLLD